MASGVNEGRNKSETSDSQQIFGHDDRAVGDDRGDDGDDGVLRRVHRAGLNRCSHGEHGGRLRDPCDDLDRRCPST